MSAAVVRGPFRDLWRALTRTTQAFGYWETAGVREDERGRVIFLIEREKANRAVAGEPEPTADDILRWLRDPSVREPQPRLNEPGS